jgi:hypothetical protein
MDLGPAVLTGNVLVGSRLGIVSLATLKVDPGFLFTIMKVMKIAMDLVAESTVPAKLRSLEGRKRLIVKGSHALNK